MKNNIFNDSMSFLEAQYAFFQAIEGKTREETMKIKSQFDKMIPVITKRELEMADKGWM